MTFLWGTIEEFSWWPDIIMNLYMVRGEGGGQNEVESKTTCFPLRFADSPETFYVVLRVPSL